MLSLPLFQHITKLFDPGKLNGDFVLHQRPAFTWGRWMDGTFQAGFDRYIEDHIGFRNFFVRLNNQIAFSIFDEVNAEGLVKGKNKILYEYDYIRAYTGGDFIGQKTIEGEMNKLKYLQDHLKQNFNIDLILIFEPSKARVQPEFIPDKYLDAGISLSNYEYFKQMAVDLKLHQIDLNQYFVDISDTATYPVYPPYGIHWSEHTMCLITDTLTSYIENIRSIDMPDYTCELRFVADSISASDMDAGMTANLLLDLPRDTLPYPFFTFHNDPTKTRPKVLAVADSYYWNIFNTRLPEHLFANQAFWYFNAKVYPDFYFHEKWTTDLDIKTEIEKQDVILLGITERFLYKFGWEFVDQLYQIYSPKYTGGLVEEKEEEIRNYSTWFDELVKKANTSKEKTLEEIIHDEAIFLAIDADLPRYLRWHGLDYYKNVIQSESAWDKSIKQKAQENKITYQEQLDKDARWLFDNNYPAIYQEFEAIQKQGQSILSDSTWLTNIQQKADYYRMPLENMIDIDAEYIATQKTETDTYKEKVAAMENEIRSNPEWLKLVKEKARDQGQSLDEMIRKDAEYMIDQQNKDKPDGK